MIECSNAHFEETPDMHPELPRYLAVGYASAIAYFFVAILLSMANVDAVRAYDRVELPPVDEAFKDPDLQDYRNTLLMAIVARDLKQVLNLTAQHFTVGHGGSGIGQKELIDYLQSEENWYGIETALRMGGTLDRERGAYRAPYIWSAILAARIDIDPFDLYAVTGQGVRVRAAPHLSAATLDIYSHEIVKRRRIEAGEFGNENWLPVTTAKGREGWIHAAYIYPALGLRVVIERWDGEWRWTGLYAGD